MKIKKQLFYFLAISILSGGFISCEKDKTEDTPPDTNDPEVITTLRVSFYDPDAQTTLEYEWADPDGAGGEAPTIDDIVLGNDVGYQVSVSVLDASDPGNVDNITDEIENEAEAHQFFYILENGAEDDVMIDYDPNNIDDNGHPIGLKTTWITTNQTDSNEKVRIVLRHEPNKSAPGASEGILSDEVGGETDIQVEFNLIIQ